MEDIFGQNLRHDHAVAKGLLRDTSDPPRSTNREKSQFQSDDCSWMKGDREGPTHRYQSVGKSSPSASSARKSRSFGMSAVCRRAGRKAVASSYSSTAGVEGGCQ